MRVLFLTTVLPGRRRMGSEVASQAIIDELLDLGLEVTVAGYVRRGESYACRPWEVCVGRRPIETRDAGALALVWLASSLVRGLPYSVAKYRSRALVAWVRAAMAEGRYDLVIVDHLQMAWLVPLLAGRARLVGMMHNVEHHMYESLAAEEQGALRRWVYAREGRLLRAREAAFARAVDEVWVLTRSDAAAFAALGSSAEITEIPLAAAATAVDGGADDKVCDVALIGSWSWRANEEGLRWFLESVRPRLPGNVTIHVAGNGASWLTDRFPNVSYVGFVDDAQRFLRQARVVAIPTLSGGGIQVKTLDAIASGSRIVATAVALRGIHDPPATVAVADHPEEFAARVTTALVAANASAAEAAVAWSRARQEQFRNTVRARVVRGSAPR